MKFPEKYIKRGRKKLHSGSITDIFYDVNSLITEDFYVRCLLDNIPDSGHYIGIATGGAIIARLVSWIRGKKFSMIKDGELKGDLPTGNYILIDDVITTGASLEEALEIIGRSPSGIYVCVDRRPKNENPQVYSIFEK